jgi:two-component system phosphate regulon sensor histidine kinase PhoR
MKINPHSISFIIAILLTGIFCLVSYFILELSGTDLLISTVVILILSYLISWGTLEFMLFRSMRKLLEIPQGEEGAEFGDQKVGVRNIQEALISYVDLKQMEIDQLKKMAIYRQEFLADISHELKTPIFAAQGYVHTLLDGAVEDSQVKMRFLKKAAKSLDGLDILVQDLLTLSMLETGQIKMDIQSISIYELALEVYEQLEERAKRRDVRLTFGSGVYKDMMVMADYHRIFQVLRNLVQNGINYTVEKGKVVIDFTPSRDHVTIHVKDNGRGIPPEHLDRIFQRFYRVEKSRTKSTNRGGTGLGLAIVKHILEQHSSQIKVKSVIDKGSDFYFDLPKAES